jgi:hypothetical protein
MRRRAQQSPNSSPSAIRSCCWASSEPSFAAGLGLAIAFGGGRVDEDRRLVQPLTGGWGAGERGGRGGGAGRAGGGYGVEGGCGGRAGLLREEGRAQDTVPARPGDLVQMDTLDVRLGHKMVFKHFGARDMASRWDVLTVGRSASAHAATTALDAVIARMPFPVRAVQVDGGSEFMAEFEQACADRGIHLFVLPPHSPKLNGRVERSHRTHTEEFY